jgi:hypothetical protein
LPIETDNTQQQHLGKTNGKEDYQAAAVDEGRCAHVEDDGSRKGENNGDRTQAQAKLGRNASEGNETWRNARGTSKEEKQFDRPAPQAMKTILIAAEDHDAMPAVLETARLIARAGSTRLGTASQSAL